MICWLAGIVFCSRSDGASVEFEDWATTKMKLRTVAETPVGNFAKVV